MGLNDFGKDIIFLLRSKAPRMIRRTRTKHTLNKSKHALSEFPLVSASNTGVFELLELPELVEIIVSHMVDILDVFGAVRLRLVNKFFDETIVPIVFSRISIRCLSSIHLFPDAQSLFGRVLETRIAKATFSPRSSLALAINRSVVLLEDLSNDLSDVAGRRSIYQKILYRRALLRRDLMTVYEDLYDICERRLDQDRSASTGALIITSVMADTSLMKTFIAQIDEESQLFGTALDAAAEYGHINAVRMLLRDSKRCCNGIHYEPHYYPVRHAIRGGQQEVVKLFLEEHRIAVAKSKRSPYPELDWFGGESSWKAIFCFAARFLESALDQAVRYRAAPTIQSLLDAGVSMSRLPKLTPDAMQRASAKGDANTVWLLLEHEFEHGNKLAEYQYYFQLAAARGHTEVLELFLDSGVDINGSFDAFRSKIPEDHDYLTYMKDRVFRYAHGHLNMNCQRRGQHQEATSIRSASLSGEGRG